MLNLFEITLTTQYGFIYLKKNTVKMWTSFITCCLIVKLKQSAAYIKNSTFRKLEAQSIDYLVKIFIYKLGYFITITHAT